MDSIISTFHIDWKIIIAQAVNFGVVFTVLYIFALKPLSKLMAERTEKIQKGVNDAKSNMLLLEQSKREYENVLTKARAEANKIWENGKKEAEAKKFSMLETARSDVAQMIDSGKKMLEMEKVKMIDDAKKEIVSLTMQAVEKLLGEKKNDSRNANLIKDLKSL